MESGEENKEINTDDKAEQERQVFSYFWAMTHPAVRFAMWSPFGHIIGGWSNRNRWLVQSLLCILIVLPVSFSAVAQNEERSYINLRAYYKAFGFSVNVYRGRIDQVAAMLQNGVDANVRDKSGLTPLRVAAAMGHEDIVELLLDHGAEIDHRGGLGETALYSAAARGLAKVVQILVRRGAAVHLQASNGLTPLLVANDAGHSETVAILKAGGATFDEVSARAFEYFIAIIDGDRKALETALTTDGSLVRVRNQRWSTGLILAAHLGWDEIVQVLQERGANIEARDDIGRTPLIVASEEGHAGIVELLLLAGADVHALDDRGRSPSSAAFIAKHADIRYRLELAGAGFWGTDHQKFLTSVLEQISRLEDQDPVVGALAAKRLGEMGSDAEAAIPALINQFGSPGSSTPLAWTPHSAPLPMDPRTTLGGEASAALVKIGDSSAWPKIRSTLYNSEACYYAAITLGLMGDPSVLMLLLDILTDAGRTHCRHLGAMPSGGGIEALAVLNDPAALSRLRDYLDELDLRDYWRAEVEGLIQQIESKNGIVRAIDGG